MAEEGTKAHKLLAELADTVAYQYRQATGHHLNQSDQDAVYFALEDVLALADLNVPAEED